MGSRLQICTRDNKQMKLKVKLPIIFSVLTLVFLLMTIVYFRMFSPNQVLTNIDYFKKNVEQVDIQLVKKINALSNNQAQLIEYLEITAKEMNISLTLYNQNFVELFAVAAQASTEKSYIFSNVYPLKMKNSETLYFVKIGHPIFIQKRINEALYKNSKNYIYLTTVVVTLFTLLFFFFHYSISIPIRLLNERLRMLTIRKKLPPLKSTRTDEIGELFLHVEEMERRIQDSHAEQVNMVGAIAHDLKTPLTSIRGFLELIQMQENLSEKKRNEYLELIFKKTQHIQHVVDEFSSYFNGVMELNDIKAEMIFLDAFLESIAMEYEAELNGLGYHFEWDLHFQPHHAVTLHEELFRRIFGNLFSNAVRYGGKESLYISLKGYTELQVAIIEIEDNGIGVPEDKLVDIFKKFYTVDASRQSEKGGTGLGLASCKSIIESFGGSIIAFSSPRGGLGIRIELPLVSSSS